MNKRSKCVLIPMSPMLKRWFEMATQAYDQILYYIRQNEFENSRAWRTAKETNTEFKRIPLNEKDVDNSGLGMYKKVRQDLLEKLGIDIPSWMVPGLIRKAKDDVVNIKKALKKYSQKKEGFLGKPRLPNYKYDTRSKYYTRYAPIRAFKSSGDFKNVDEDIRRISIGLVKDPSNRLDLIVPNIVDFASLQCIQLAYHSKSKAKVIFMFDRQPSQQIGGDLVMGIDLGVDNLIAATVNGKDVSFIIKGGELKSINQYYNKRLAEMKTVLSHTSSRKTSARIQQLTAKRNSKIDYELHCISKRIITFAIEHKIGRIVIGHNTGWKNKVDLGHKTNQKFVQLPFTKLISLVKSKGEDAGIVVEEVCESYTSKVDHLAMETLQHHDTYLGKRVTRGQFVSSTGNRINADLNGALGILRVGKGITEEQLKHCNDRKDLFSPCSIRYKPIQGSYKGAWKGKQSSWRGTESAKEFREQALKKEAENKKVHEQDKPIINLASEATYTQLELPLAM